MTQARGRARNVARYAAPWDDRQARLTPPEILDAVRSAMGGAIPLDVCTEPDNPTGAVRFYALPQDGCTLPWDAPAWCNPPWGDASRRWIRRALEVGQAGGVVALLVPASTDTPRSQAVLRGADRVTFVAGRPRFDALRPNGWRATTPGAVMLATWGLPPIEGLGVTLAPIPQA